ncbi:Hypothetical Protein FCC1311_086642 [Hondaea fermentalgiana]|uniref:BZIP domain-containing protein n=1 Tax=Hondaea fermentalgiana TaxID=2315210 RepID=A0A2R5GQ61_9STRA|nr:Hypothetical Protein FCC1311_086642 [Hondaea fermentalgiana]|eukprot:GBG32439.1 Hypothetical Protein FCC1311_086642 [Hondaea fermentalgiana]
MSTPKRPRKAESPGGANSGANAAAAAGNAAKQQKKKKEKVNDLEERVNKLESENLQLRLQLKVGKETVQRDAQEKLEITQRLEEMLSRGASDTELQAVLETYVKKFSDYGEVRTDSIRRHMEQLERLLLPTQVTKMCMWSLHQDDDFYDSTSEQNLNASGAGSIWSMIMREIGASEEQKEKIKGHRNDARQMAKDLRFTLRECDDLKRRMERKNQALGEEMKELQKILTPAQLARFILWVNNNPASMAMLDKLWSPVDELSKGRVVN